MWGFTRQEQRAILLLLLTFVAGSLVWWYRQRQSPPVVARVEVATFEKYASLLRREDSVAALLDTGDQREKKPSSTLLDLNAATYEELLQLPGVGPVLAKRIVEHRRANGPFRHLEELKNVKGIGAKTYVKLARLLMIK